MNADFNILPLNPLIPPSLDTPHSLCYKVSKAALAKLIKGEVVDQCNVYVSDAVLKHLKGQPTRMTNHDWITVKFLAAVANKQDIESQATSMINFPEFIVDLKYSFTAPIPIKPEAKGADKTIIDLMKRNKEIISRVDISSVSPDPNKLRIVLSVKGKKLELPSFQNSSSLTKLTSLSVSYQPFSGDYNPALESAIVEKLDLETTLDLTPFPCLRHLTINSWFKTDITHLHKLQSLTINAKSCPKDLTAFPDLTHLEIANSDHPLPRFNASAIVSLTLRFSKLTDLNFLADFVNLTSLKICNCYELEDVSVITKLTHLTSLSFDSCLNLEEIPDLTNNEKLELLELSRVFNLIKLPKVRPSTKVTISEMNYRDLEFHDERGETCVESNDPYCKVFEITTVTPYRKIHLENLPNLSSFYCYFTIEVGAIYLKKLGKCESIDLSDIKETKSISIIDCPLIQTIAFNAQWLTHLTLVDLPGLQELTITEFPRLKTMTLPPFVERVGDDVLKFNQVTPEEKNCFLRALKDEILRYNTLKEIEKDRKWELFYSIMDRSDYMDFIRIMGLHFRPFMVSISARKAERIPFHAKLYFLSRLSPEGVRYAVNWAGATHLNRWCNAVRVVEGKHVKVRDQLRSIKLDEILPTDLEIIDKTPGRNFMALYLESPAFIEPFIPLMNEYQLRVLIPMMSVEQFKQLVAKQPDKESVYLSHATNEQKRN